MLVANPHFHVGYDETLIGVRMGMDADAVQNHGRLCGGDLLGQIIWRIRVSSDIAQMTFQAVSLRSLEACFAA